MCEVLNINRIEFYRYENKKDKSKQNVNEQQKLESKIKEIKANNRFYGYRRVTKELHRCGMKVNHKSVLKILRKNELLCNKRKSKKIFTTDSNHNNRVYPNLIKGLDITRLNQVWVSDITYIPFNGKFLYLSIILDAFSRRCIGWSLSVSLESDIVIRSLDKALSHRDISNNLIHHSDRGVQYTSNKYITMLSNNRITVSMSRSGNPYDNAICERFMRTLKEEEVNISDYRSGSDVRNGIESFITHYNNNRLHSSIGYLSPSEFEEKLTKTINIVTI